MQRLGRYLSLCVLVAMVGLGTEAIALDHTSTGFVYPIGVGSWNHACGGWLERSSPNGCYTAGYYHIAEDMLTGEGSSVYAISDGDIARIWTTNASDSYYIGTGNSVMFVQHRLQDGSYFLAEYMHVRPTVWSGHVVAGQEIARVGPWYNSTHLHFGIHPDTSVPTTSWGRMANSAWPNTNGFVDPVDWIRTRGPWSDCSPATVGWSSLPAQVWYRTDQRLTYGVGGTSPSVQEDPSDGSIGDMYLSQKPAGSNHYHVHVYNSCNTGGSDIDWVGYWDNVPPSASRSGGAAPSTWYRTPQTVSWVCSDANSGVRRHWYRWNGGAWVGASGSTALVEGQNNLEVLVEDNAYNGDTNQSGNTAVVNLGQYWLDTVSPSLSLTGPTTSHWLNTPQSVTWSATDVTSDIATKTLTWDNGAHTDQIPEGKRTATVWAEDNALNEATQNFGPFWIDTLAPVVSVIPDPASPNGDNGWYTMNPTLAVSATDPNGSDGSDVNGLFYSIDGVEHPYTGPVIVSGDGVYPCAGRATDVAGNSGTSPIEVRIDTSEPVFAAMHTQPESLSLSTLTASWECSDLDSGIAEYEYSIYRETGDEDELVVGPVTTTNSWAQETNLGLMRGQTYYFRVRAMNNAGLYTSFIASDSILANEGTADLAPSFNSGGVSVNAEARASTNYLLVDSMGQFVVDTSTSGGLTLESGYWHSEVVTTDAPTVASSKTLENGRLITLGTPDKPVVVTVLFADRFYVEQLDRSSGIAAQVGSGLGMSLAAGDRVWVIGTTGAIDGERVILDAAPTFVSHADPLGALFVSNSWLGGSDLNAMTHGIDGAAGLNNIGLLIKTCGRVTQVDPAGAYFYIDDGAGLADGTYTLGQANIGVRIAIDGRSLTPGRFVAVTGASSCFTGEDAKIKRLIRAIAVEQL